MSASYGRARRAAVGRRSAWLRRPLRAAGRSSTLLIMVLGLLATALCATSATPAFAAPAQTRIAKPAAAPKPADFGPGATTSADLAINGFGDSAGYHLEVGRESSAFAWHEIAVLRPDGYDDSSWTGYQCVSGDGRFAAVAILPASAVNIEDARDQGRRRRRLVQRSVRVPLERRDGAPFEERITPWRAESLEGAIELAEAEAEEYARGTGWEPSAGAGVRPGAGC